MEKRYQCTYRLFGVAMIVAPLVAIALAKANVRTFWIETAGVLVFGSYWIVKSFEIKRSNSDRHAVAGRLSTRSYGIRDAFKEVTVQPVPADASTHGSNS